MSPTWQAVEALGAAYFIEKGYSILVPFGDSHHYDFVAEKDGSFIRVNVKKAFFSMHSWRISLSGGRLGTDKCSHVDCFLAYLPEHKCFIELSGDFFHQARSRARTIPKEIVEQVCNSQNLS